MRCFYVLIHGSLNWHEAQIPDDPVGNDRPTGFWCHRYVLATDKAGAEIKAMRRVRDNLEREVRWISKGLATLDLRAEEVSFAPIIKMMKPENKGHTFYVDP